MWIDLKCARHACSRVARYRVRAYEGWCRQRICRRCVEEFAEDCARAGCDCVVQDVTNGDLYEVEASFDAPN